MLKDESGSFINLSNDLCLILSDISSEYLKMFAQLYEIWNGGICGYTLKCKAIFTELLFRFLVDNKKYVQENKYKNIMDGIIYLENNYISDISVDELARLCSVSEETFRRLFKSYYGVSPTSYRNKLRIRKAIELLESGEYNVSETTGILNFSDIYYFSKLFKNITGKNPKYFIQH